MNSKNTADRTHYFNDLGPRWDEVVGNDAGRRARIAEIFGTLTIQKGDRVLDAGTGNGVLLPFIEEKTGPKGKIVAVDAAPAMIARAQELNTRYSNIEYRIGSLENIELPSRFFDVILCFAVVPHLDDFLKSFNNLKSSMKDNGVLYIFHLNDTRSLNEFHRGLNAPVRDDMLPEEKELKDLLAVSGFAVVHYVDRPGLNFVECRQ